MLDKNASAGATPVVPGATPGQTEPAPATEPIAPAAPATGDEGALGDAGKRALNAMKDERNAALEAKKAAEKTLEELRLSTASDSEKALAQAKKDGAAEVLTKVQSQIRRSEVKAALTGAGINASVLDLAVNAPEFMALKVDDEGVVAGLEAAVTAFKTARKDLFGTPPPAGGSSDGGTRGAARLSKEQVAAWSKDPIEYEKHREEIFAWMTQGGTL